MDGAAPLRAESGRAAGRRRRTRGGRLPAGAYQARSGPTVEHRALPGGDFGADALLVTGLPGEAEPCPGLLSEWIRDGEEGPWRGRVVYAVVDDGRVVLVEAWVAADHLRPAATDPPR